MFLFQEMMSFLLLFELKDTQPSFYASILSWLIPVYTYALYFTTTLLTATVSIFWWLNSDAKH